MQKHKKKNKINSNQKKKHRATPTHNTSTHNISESNDKIKDIKNSQRGNSYHTNNYFCERHQSTQLTVILRARRQWINALIILVENYFKTWGLFSAKLSIKHDRYSFGQYLRKTVWTTNQEKLPEGAFHQNKIKTEKRKTWQCTIKNLTFFSGSWKGD